MKLLPIIIVVLHQLNAHNPSSWAVYLIVETIAAHFAANRTSSSASAANKENKRQEREHVVIRTDCTPRMNPAAAEGRLREIDIYLFFEAPAQLQSQVINH